MATETDRVKAFSQGRRREENLGGGPQTLIIAKETTNLKEFVVVLLVQPVS